jgi:hypothetical protein
MASFTDFEGELMMLQMMRQSMDVMIDRTLKCYSEFASEGIKYAWALAKNLFPHIFLEEKR